VNARTLGGALKVAGWPIRMLLLGLVRGYRLTLGPVVGGRCRFYPSCSAYAEEAIRELGALRGVGLAVWRVLRCSPLSAGGVDYPPGHGEHGRAPVYDDAIQPGDIGGVAKPGAAA
jgi:putative membrane protein insertion efficiency factor